MPSFRTFAVAAAVLAWSPTASASGLFCDNDRYPCNVFSSQSISDPPSSQEIIVIKRVRYVAGRIRAAAFKLSAAKRAEADGEARGIKAPGPPIEKALGEKPPAPPIEKPRSVTDGVRVFANDELSEIDLNAGAAARPPRQQLSFVEPIVNNAPPEKTRAVVSEKARDVVPEKARAVDLAESVTNRRASDTPDQTLLNRIVMTFGSALAAASAIRIFFA